MHRLWLTVAINYMYRNEVIKPSLLTDPSVLDNAVRWSHALGNHKGRFTGEAKHYCAVVEDSRTGTTMECWTKKCRH